VTPAGFEPALPP